MIKKIELNKNIRIANNFSSKFPYVVALQQRIKVITRLSSLTSFPFLKTQKKLLEPRGIQVQARQAPSLARTHYLLVLALQD